MKSSPPPPPLPQECYSSLLMHCTLAQKCKTQYTKLKTQHTTTHIHTQITIKTQYMKPKHNTLTIKTQYTKHYKPMY